MEEENKKIWQAAYILTKHLQRFVRIDQISGKILMVLCVLSLLVANIPVCAGYVHFWHWVLPVVPQGFHLPDTPQHIINDCLMPLFFFIVGVEIRHELHEGTLNSVKKASLPLFAAIGGMIVPATLYAFVNKGLPTLAGWAIPTATDITFSIAILGLLGDRIHRSTKVFLLALAIFDDLGAIFVIALFYGGTLHLPIFLLCIGVVVGLYFVYKYFPRFPLGLSVCAFVLVMYLLHLAGIHSTMAGVIAAFLLPHKQAKWGFDRLINPVNFVVLPLFILPNTAVPLQFHSVVVPGSVLLGIFLGLCVGKPLGIYLFSRFSARLKLAALPRGMTRHQLVGVGLIAGIGFTMSLFVAQLGFAGAPTVLAFARIAVIGASFLSAALAWAWFRLPFTSRLL